MSSLHLFLKDLLYVQRNVSQSKSSLNMLHKSTHRQFVKSTCSNYLFVEFSHVLLILSCVSGVMRELECHCQCAITKTNQAWFCSILHSLHHVVQKKRKSLENYMETVHLSKSKMKELVGTGCQQLTCLFFDV